MPFTTFFNHEKVRLKYLASIGKTMVEFTATMREDNGSVKITIPSFLVKAYNLKTGDSIRLNLILRKA